MCSIANIAPLRCKVIVNQYVCLSVCLLVCHVKIIFWKLCLVECRQKIYKCLHAYSVLSDNMGFKAICGPTKHRIGCIVRIRPHSNPNPNPQSQLTLTVPAACQTTTWFGRVHQNAALGAKFAIYNWYDLFNLCSVFVICSCKDSWKNGNCTFIDIIWQLLMTHFSFCFASYALTLLAGRQEGHPAHKNMEWWGAGVIMSGAKCKWRQCYPSSLASLKSRIFLPFLYRLTQVVLEKKPLSSYDSF